MLLSPIIDKFESKVPRTRPRYSKGRTGVSYFPTATNHGYGSPVKARAKLQARCKFSPSARVEN